MKKVYFLVSLLSMASAFAADLKIAPYVQMQEALAADNFKAALESHKTICANKSLYKDCSKNFKNIEELRTSFKALSEIYLKDGNKKEMEQFQKASCPMAEAKWIQKKGELANPYYGKSMLTCGEKI